MEHSRRRILRSGVMGTSAAVLAGTRPKQWTKNLIIYFALFFAVNEAWDVGDTARMGLLLAKATAAFALFSVVSGAVYLMNDILDAERDRRHRSKRLRPVASQRLAVPAAWASAGVLAIVGLGASLALEPAFALVALLYLGTMSAYTLVLKRLVFLDVASIAAGFVLRAVAGAAAIQVPISPWLYTCTGLGALFIALAKRRSELLSAGEQAGRQRDSLASYSAPLLGRLMLGAAATTLVAYAVYAFTADNLPGNHAMAVTIPIVAFGLSRYLYLAHARHLGENPEDILISDIPLIASIVTWLLVAATVLLLFR